MEKLPTRSLILFLFLISLLADATTTPDQVRIEVDQIIIKDMSVRRGPGSIELSDYLILSLALYDTTFVPFKMENNKARQLVYDFKVAGKGSLTTSAFYLNLSLTDKNGNEFPIEPLFGKPEEFNSKLNESLQLIYRYIKSNGSRNLLTKRIGFVIRKNMANKNGNVPDELLNDIARQVVTVLKGRKNEVVQLSTTNLSNDSINDLLLDKYKIDCLFYCDFNLADNLNISFFPRLLIKGFKQAIELPVIEVHLDSDIENFKRGIGSDFIDLLSFISKPDGSWNKIHIDTLVDVIHVPKDSLRSKSEQQIKKKNYLLAMFYASQGMKQFPKSEVYPQLIAKSRLAQIRYPEAILFLNTAIALNTKNVFSYLLKAQVAKENGDYGLALEELDEVEKIDSTANDPELGDLKLMRGINYYFIDSINLAIRNLKGAKRITPKHAQFRNRKYYLAAAYYAKKDFSTAIAEFDDYLKLNPADETMRRHKGDIYADWGFQEYERKNYNLSWKLYKDGLSYGTTNHVSWTSALFPLNTLLKFGTADSLISMAIKKGVIVPEKVYNTNAYILYEISLDAEEHSELFVRKSIEFMNKHLEENPTDAESRAFIGRLYNSLTEFSRGIKALKEAVAIDGNSIAHKLDLAEAFIMANRPKEVSSVFDANVSKYESNARDYSLVLFLKYVSGLVQKDMGASTQDYLSLISKLNPILAKKEIIVTDWIYDGFDNWLADYQGGSKDLIAEVTTKMKAISEQVN